MICKIEILLIRFMIPYIYIYIYIYILYLIIKKKLKRNLDIYIIQKDSESIIFDNLGSKYVFIFTVILLFLTF